MNWIKRVKRGDDLSGKLKTGFLLKLYYYTIVRAIHDCELVSRQFYYDYATVVKH